jgi:Rnl2 family RNA ligase
MKFVKYSSIKTLYNPIQDIINDLSDYPCINEKWIVQEKIHGANFSFHFSNSDCKCASRNKFLTKESYKTFFNCDKFVEELTPKIKVLYNTLLKSPLDHVQDIDNTISYIIKESDTVIIYGEYCGGLFPEYKNQNKAIQKGIYYHFDHKFIIFDIKLILNETKTSLYIPYLDYEPILLLLNLDYSQILFKGSLLDCIEFSNNTNADNSSIPTMFNLPLSINNIREGNVIKPIKSANFHNGSRICFKDKNSKYSETPKLKYENDDTKPKVKNNMLNMLKNQLTLYINENRLNNVLSKLGDSELLLLDETNHKKIINSLVKDACDEFYENIENKELFTLNTPTTTKYKKILQQSCYKTSTFFINNLYKKLKNDN